MNTRNINHTLNLFVVLLMSFAITSPSNAAQKFHPWKMENYAINKPLGGFSGNAQRGRKIVIDKDKGNCLACHALPIAEESFHGTVGPALHGIASRLTRAQLRLRVADEQKVNPMTIMPGFYKNPKENNRVDDEYWGKPVLTAQEAEDVIAYLMTLK
ncbi:MAG: sulfur oxidation c-type cytochrome SoxX [Gammaproteobacteria bacterium]|nr:sulfur oxidation c-type cytochrome SoxX [Gammaproteobacteria bacterium]